MPATEIASWVVAVVGIALVLFAIVDWIIDKRRERRHPHLCAYCLLELAEQPAPAESLVEGTAVCAEHIAPAFRHKRHGAAVEYRDAVRELLDDVAARGLVVRESRQRAAGR